MGAVAIAIVACGGSSSDNPPANTDAGTNNHPDTGVVVDSSVADTNVPDTAVACVPDADLTTLSPPDAALDDAGASVGTCLGCAKTTCTTQLAACNKDCSCASAFACLYECQGNPDPDAGAACLSKCGINFQAQGPTQTLGICVITSCGAKCGINLTPPTPDAGPADGGHDAADAKTD